VEEAFRQFRDRVYLISFTGDTLFFPEEMREIKHYLDRVGGFCRLFEIESDYGHDSFLVETHLFEEIIADILAGKEV
jgi:homoserine O-acetyltransferase